MKTIYSQTFLDIKQYKRFLGILEVEHIYMGMFWWSEQTY